MGVLAGNAAIAFGMLLTAAYPTSGLPILFFAALGIEFFTGIFLVINSRAWRPFGIGLIAAAPIGLMLFFVGCFLLYAAYG